MDNHENTGKPVPEAYLSQSTLVSLVPQYSNVILLQEIPIAGLPLHQVSNNLQVQGLDEQLLVPVEKLQDNKASNMTQVLADQYPIGSSQKCYPNSDALQNVSPNRLVSIDPLQISTKTNKLNVLRKIQAKTCNLMGQPSLVEEKDRKESTITEEAEVQRMDVSVEVTIKETPRITSRRLNTKYVSIRDRVVPPRALAVLPAALQLRRGDVFACPRALPTRVRFGPAVGVCKKLAYKEVVQLVIESTESQKPVFLLTHSDGSVTYIDMSDKDKSNWLALLPLGDDNTANVWLEQDEDQLYGVTTRPIDTRTALRLGYSKTYADTYGIADGVPVMDLNSELALWPSEWWCIGCSKAMPSLVELERHSEWHMKHEKMMRRESPYRRRNIFCRYCTRRFSNRSSLKRHLRNYCAKKKLKDQTPETKPTDPETPAEETRLPSDESLQNYTNILDISTSLFDADRIALDVSGCKSESELNAFDIRDGRLPGDFALDDFIDGLASPEKKAGGRKKPNIVSSSPITCPYCKVDMPRSKLNHHSRVCSARRFVCKCGVVCRSQQKLSFHIMTRHPAEQYEPDDKLHEGLPVPRIRRAVKMPREEDTSENEGKLYECKTCGIVFKRRGMYVNHLSRTHGTAAAVPLVVRDKRYPCPACPKLYRAAAKRDRHVTQHHPGTNYKRLVIEGTTRTKEPSLCWACPKQYATRAKLLQHARATHPDEVAPVKRKYSLSKNRQ